MRLKSKRGSSILISYDWMSRKGESAWDILRHSERQRLIHNNNDNIIDE